MKNVIGLLICCMIFGPVWNVDRVNSVVWKTTSQDSLTKANKLARLLGKIENFREKFMNLESWLDLYGRYSLGQFTEFEKCFDNIKNAYEELGEPFTLGDILLGDIINNSSNRDRIKPQMAFLYKKIHRFGGHANSPGLDLIVDEKTGTYELREDVEKRQREAQDDSETED
ncbi:MAG: hypothetical protein LBQ08_03700 [Holosporaceae bacterium]|nr:hypothetical protein [Holosporaceae bacterium]